MVLHHGGHGVPRSLFFALRMVNLSSVRLCVTLWCGNAKIIPQQSAMSGIVRICPLLSGNVRFSVKINVNSLVEWWKIRIFKY